MNENQTMVKMALDRWNIEIDKFTSIVDSLSDDRLMQEIAPNKNRGIYVFGHIVGVHDDMLQILNFGTKQYPELFEIFLKSPDKAVAQIPSVAELRDSWKKVNEIMNEKINTLSAEDWFQKHNSVSAEDFAKEPHRNKLNVIISRTNHLCYHAGQLVLLK